MKSICVYCGLSSGKRPEYTEAARKLGKELVNRGIRLVYGGARLGLMGIIAQSVLAEGGEVIGIIPRALAEKEACPTDLTELRIVQSMHERKAVMANLSDGFIALPGGLGTLEEIFEILTWLQLGFHNKLCALLNVCGYYDKISIFLNHAVNEQFVKKRHHSLLYIEKDIKRLLNVYERYKSPELERFALHDDQTLNVTNKQAVTTSFSL